MNRNLGFIGLGKMATAIIAGILESNFSSSVSIRGYDTNKEAIKKLENKKNFTGYTSIKDTVENSDIIFVCTKPFVIKDVLKEIKMYLSNQTTVSIAAGVTISNITDILGENSKVIRIMPNTPALVKTGMSAITFNTNTDKETVEFVKKVFGSIGRITETEEGKFDAITALSGSGPAFYYYLINQLALAGVKEGLKYEEALLLSAQTALGAAKMILDTNDTPETLIKNVTTPGGTTEAGNEVLNSSDISFILESVISQTARKSRELGKQV